MSRWPFVVLLLIMTLFCTGCMTGQNNRTVSESPDGIHHGSQVEYQIADSDTSLSLPSGWSAEIVNGSYLSAEDQTRKFRVTVFPVSYPEGELDAMDIANDAYDLLNPEPGNLSGHSVLQTDDISLVDMILTTEGPENRTYALMAYAGDNAGIAFCYDGPVSSFNELIPQARQILESIGPAGMNLSGADTINLHETSPVVLPTTYDPDFAGAVTLATPSGWTAGQQQSGSCLVNWWTGDWRYYQQAFALQNVYSFSSEDAKTKVLENTMKSSGNISLQQTILLTRTPVSGPDPRDFIETTLPAITRDPGFMIYYPSIMGITNITITSEWQVSPSLKQICSSIPGSRIAGYIVSFVRDKTPETARVIVLTAPDESGYGTNVKFWGIAAPVESFSDDEALLLTVFGSVREDLTLTDPCTDTLPLLKMIQHTDMAVPEKNVNISWNWSESASPALSFWAPSINGDINRSTWFFDSLLPLKEDS